MTGPERRYRGTGHAGEVVERRPRADLRIPPDPRPEGLRLKVQALVWTVAWEIARRLPEVLAFALADLLAAVLHRLSRATRTQVRRNLSRVVEEEALDDAVRAAFRSYGRYWVESFRAADIPVAAVDRRTTTEGFPGLDRALDDGAGAIMLLAHHGSWDMAARWAESHGYHLAVVAEVLRPRALFVKFVRLREAVGLEIVPLVPRRALRPGGGSDAAAAVERQRDSTAARLSEVLAANHLVGLLSDRDLSGTAPVVDFFGEETRIPPGPVILSRRTGAAIFPATMLQRPGRRWHLRIFDPITPPADIKQGCQALARALEEVIRLDPTQWHAFSPVWLADLPEHRRGAWEPGPVTDR